MRSTCARGAACCSARAVRRAPLHTRYSMRASASSLWLNRNAERADALVDSIGDPQRVHTRDRADQQYDDKHVADHDEQIDVSGHRLRASARVPPLEAKRARLDAVDDGLIIFEEADGNDVAGNGHKSFAGHSSSQLSGSHAAFPVDRNSCRVLSGRDDERPLWRRYAQDCTLSTANDKKTVVYLTLSIEGGADDARRNAIDAAVTRRGGTAVWRTSAASHRSYALLELPEQHDREIIAAVAGGTLYDRTIIALAVFPAVREALPQLVEAVTGAGKPVGVLAVYACDGGVIVEWDPSATSVAVVLGLLDIELRRFESGRTAELLAPIPPSIAALVAGSGLQAPQIEALRILELRTENA